MPNPLNKSKAGKSALIIVASITLSLFLFPQIVARAVDCDDFSDADDRIKCLEEKIEKKEDQYESTSKKLDDVKNQQESISKQISDLASKSSVTQAELNNVQNQINQLTQRLNVLQENLKDRRTSLSHKISVRDKAVRKFYQQGQLGNFEVLFLRAAPAGLNGFEYANHSYSIEKSVNKESVRLIHNLNAEISNFEKDKADAEKIKKSVEATQQQLVALKADLDNKKNQAQSEFNVLGEKKSGYESTLKNLSEEIASLSEKQQSIINAKSGGDNGTVGDYDSPEVEVPDAPFSPAFGAFSYGAYTHYKGMSQFGAKGRAEDGQDYKEIIEFYYDNDVKDEDLPDEIEVQGYGKMDFQRYLYGLAEMPSNWPEDALKAQAVAGRTYAYRYYKAGKAICTNEACQVFSKSKSDNPPDSWKKAVDDTEDKIISGDSHAMYSSTTGGYIDNIGWDKDGSWPGGAYEKKAKSPWFYWAWYTQGYKMTSGSCDRDHPWLNDKEMADILNAIVVWDNGSGDEKDHISPVSCWDGDPYSLDEMRDKAKKYGKSFSKVTSVDTDIGNDGRTSKVTFQTDNGSISINGDKFKTVFNLRAPGYISIKSRLYELKKD
jgi:peptidoglycan hydrolase-like amidase/peptidoglycan hydrolase CwlO-like protein